MKNVSILVAVLALGTLAGSQIPRGAAQLPGTPRAFEYACIDNLEGRDNAEHLAQELNMRGRAGWRYIGMSAFSPTSVAYCFERPM